MIKSKLLNSLPTLTGLVEIEEVSSVGCYIFEEIFYCYSVVIANNARAINNSLEFRFINLVD
jgi:hypothetical protein